MSEDPGWAERRCGEIETELAELEHLCDAMTKRIALLENEREQLEESIGLRNENADAAYGRSL